MSNMRARYPDRDDFLSSEFIQDPHDDRSLLEIAKDFTGTRPPENVLAVARDIRRFLLDQHNGAEIAFGDFLRRYIHPESALRLRHSCPKSQT